MIRELAIENFKSIGAELRLELRPLTLLFGRTGSGKSNILEALWRFARLVAGERGMDRLHAVPPAYPSEDMVFHKRDTSRPLKMELHVEPSEEERERLNELAKPLGKRLEAGDTIGWRIIYSSIWRSQAVLLAEEELVEVEQVRHGDTWGRPWIKCPEGFEELIVGTPTSLNPRNVYTATVREMPITTFRRYFAQEELLPKYRPFMELAVEIVRVVSKRLAGEGKCRVALLPPLRGHIPFTVELREQKAVKAQASASASAGGVAVQEDTITMLTLMADSRAYKESWEAVCRWARRFGLADMRSGLRREKGAWALGADYFDEVFHAVLDAALASHGMKQALAMIAQLFWPEHAVVLIEEPEISLHPEAVAMLPLMFYDAIKMGKQIIATTHSPILPLAISRMVEKAREEGFAERAEELISVYEIDRTSEGTVAKRLKLDEWGYIEGYVPSFFKVESELLREWERRLPSE